MNAAAKHAGVRELGKQALMFRICSQHACREVAALQKCDVCSNELASADSLCRGGLALAGKLSYANP